MPLLIRRPAPTPESRRRFLRRATGVAATGLLLPGLDWAAVYARAAAHGITPGTLVEADGRARAPLMAGMNPFVGEICLFPFNFQPKNWAWCEGQLLPIAQHTALFALLGITYGGNGRTNFALPNLQGASPMGVGQGPGLSNRVLGEAGGSDTVTLLATEMPGHTHTVNTGAGRRRLVPASDVRAPLVSEDNSYGTLAGGAMADLVAVGGGQAHNNLPPYLTLNFCIALTGTFPSRP